MNRDFQPAVYLLASKRNGTLYTGVTSGLLGRIYQHRNGLLPGFTREHGVKLLVWYEVHDTMESAILREKRIILGSRFRGNDELGNVRFRPKASIAG